MHAREEQDVVLDPGVEVDEVESVSKVGDLGKGGQDGSQHPQRAMIGPDKGAHRS